MEENSESPILLVEDSPEDYMMVKRAFKKTNVTNPLYRCENGDDALDYLLHNGKYSDHSNSPRPSIILLDLNMPGTDGWEVLGFLKSNEKLRSIPVIVLTSSSDEIDINKCYEAGANSYITKPVVFDSFIESLKLLKEYWFKLSILPKG